MLQDILFLAIGLLVGGVLGFFITRAIFLKNYILKSELEDKFISIEAYNLVNKEKEELKEENKNYNNKILELTTQLAEFKKEKEHLDEKINTFYKEIENLHTTSKEQFKNLATDILEEKKKLFVEKNKDELGNILNPLKTDLSTFKKTVEDTRKEDIKDLTSLKKEIESLQKLNTQLSDDAKNLTNALKSESKIQGNWGEDRLKMILEIEGLQKYIDYESQSSYTDEEQEKNRRPDFILNLPNERHIRVLWRKQG